MIFFTKSSQGLKSACHLKSNNEKPIAGIPSVPASIAAWRFVIKKQSDPKARLEGHVHLAQLQSQHKDRKAAIKDFETALGLWGQLGRCQDDTCKQLHTRLRQFVLDWNKLEKKKPSQELLEAYQAYLVVFAGELDMRLWEAQVASQVKDHELAIKENLHVAKALHEEAGSKKIDKKKGEEEILNVLEKEMDKMNEHLPEMRSFVLPGGHTTVSYCHICRCVCRRAERLISHLIELENIESYHICVDTSHISCDGYCICDGLGCY